LSRIQPARSAARFRDSGIAAIAVASETFPGKRSSCGRRSARFRCRNSLSPRKIFERLHQVACAYFHAWQMSSRIRRSIVLSPAISANRHASDLRFTSNAVRFRRPTAGSELSLLLFRRLSSSETTGNSSAAQYFTKDARLPHSLAGAMERIKLRVEPAPIQPWMTREK
jgi:hypothetical protein